MFSRDQTPLHNRVPRLASYVVLLIALAALLGWTIDSDLLKGWIVASVAMNYVTALTMVVAAGGLYLLSYPAPLRRQRIFARACGFVVILVGLLRSVEYLTGWGVAFDRAFFSQTVGRNQVAPNTALAFLAVGAAICTMDVRIGRVFVAEILSGAALIGAFTSVLGYAYGLSSLYGLGSYISMAMNTSAAFAILGVGLLAARPARGLMSVVTSAAAGKLIFSRMLPAGLVITLLVGYLRLQGERWGWYSEEFGMLLHVMFTIVAILATLFWTSHELNRIDERRARETERAIVSERRTRDLYENAPCGYHSLDADGRIIEINSTELKWLGYSRHEMIGRQLFDFQAEPYRAAWWSHFHHVRETGIGREIEYALLRKDGTELPVMVSATTVRDQDGNFLHTHTTVFDISERKEHERRIQSLNHELEERVAQRTAELEAANQKLSERNRENETFVYSVSHDLRSPLVNLQGFSHEIESGCRTLREILADARVPEELQRSASQVLDGDLREAIEFIKAAVKRLGGIIDALLRLSRAGRVEYQWQTVNTNAIAVRSVQASAAVIGSRDANVEVGSLPPAWGDPTAIEQVFANLIGNALNYLDPSRPGKIRVTAEDGPATLHHGNGRHFYTYCVRDNGLGIPAAHQSKIFSAFQRAHPKAAIGEGMGLTLVKQIVERHGGEIWFDSVEGQGTAFYVKLPKAGQHQETEAAV